MRSHCYFIFFHIKSRQREVQLEARARKLKESLKTGEVTSSQIAQQRDALQAEYGFNFFKLLFSVRYLLVKSLSLALLSAGVVKLISDQLLNKFPLKKRKGRLYYNSKRFFRTQDLKEQIESLTNVNKATIHELNKELKDLKSTIDEQRKQLQHETEQRKHVQERLKETEKYIEELKVKNAELENSQPNPGKGKKYSIN